MKRIITWFLLTITFLSFQNIAFSQEPNWHSKLKQIKPLKSTTEDIERIFDNPKLIKSFIYEGIESAFYETLEGKISIKYSAGECAFGRKDDYSVEKGKVINIIFFAKTEVKLSKFKINKKDFDTQMEDDNPTLHYFNKGLGIDYAVQRGRVKNVELFPASKYNHLKCKNFAK